MQGAGIINSILLWSQPAGQGQENELDACGRDGNVDGDISGFGKDIQGGGVKLPQGGMADGNTLRMVDVIEGAEGGVEGVGREREERVKEGGDKVDGAEDFFARVRRRGLVCCQSSETDGGGTEDVRGKRGGKGGKGGWNGGEKDCGIDVVIWRGGENWKREQRMKGMRVGGREQRGRS